MTWEARLHPGGEGRLLTLFLELGKRSEEVSHYKGDTFMEGGIEREKWEHI